VHAVVLSYSFNRNRLEGNWSDVQNNMKVDGGGDDDDDDDDDDAAVYKDVSDYDGVDIV